MMSSCCNVVLRALKQLTSGVNPLLLVDSETVPRVHKLSRDIEEASQHPDVGFDQVWLLLSTALVSLIDVT